MIDRFEIIDHVSPRPEAERILFCDGTGGKLFRAEADLELSHWRPNRTPADYRAGTSTEICFRFLDDPRPGESAHTRTPRTITAPHPLPLPTPLAMELA
jgi:hypothetical protein